MLMNGLFKTTKDHAANIIQSVTSNNAPNAIRNDASPKTLNIYSNEIKKCRNTGENKRGLNDESDALSIRKADQAAFGLCSRSHCSCVACSTTRF